MVQCLQQRNKLPNVAKRGLCRRKLAPGDMPLTLTMKIQVALVLISWIDKVFANVLVQRNVEEAPC